MSKTNLVFISYTNADRATASQVAASLKEAGIETLLDRQLAPGDSFVTYMERGIAAANYFLLLWSQAASDSKWVQAEWEAAFHRAIQLSGTFLVVGRLHELPVPTLLSPRVRIDLFPALQPGLEQLMQMWQADRRAEAIAQKPVAAPRSVELTSEGEETIYITSDAFGVTLPFNARLSAPAGVYLDRVVARLDLPTVLEHSPQMGVRFTYRLMHDKQPLERGLSLRQQGIENNSVLWLETTMEPFASAQPITGPIQPVVFRGEDSRSEIRARRHLQAVLADKGLLGSN
jgi:hypothetical protein